MSFEDFLNLVSPETKEDVRRIHDSLLARGYKFKVTQAKSGPVVSYTHPKTGHVVLNYVFRKSGMQARIYGNNSGGYPEFLQELPDDMKASIVKSMDCRRYLDPTTCTPKCGTGYEIHLDGTFYKKCRYRCFLFPASAENMPYIAEFVEKEAALRES